MPGDDGERQVGARRFRRSGGRSGSSAAAALRAGVSSGGQWSDRAPWPAKLPRTARQRQARAHPPVGDANRLAHERWFENSIRDERDLRVAVELLVASSVRWTVVPSSRQIGDRA